jgi:hypothetical protein
VSGRRHAKSKAQVKAEKMAALDKNYKKALRILQGHIKQGVPVDHWEPVFSATMIRRMNAEESLPAIQRRRLVVVMTGGIGVYSAIAKAIGQEDVSEGIRKLCGKYHYFRLDNPASQNLSEGRIAIREKGSDILFEHWSPEWQKDEPEHGGRAFLVDKRLFMLGWKPNVLRLGIAYCPEDHEGVMSGYVLSVRSGGNHAIFAASSILVRADKQEDLALFRSDNAHQLFLERHEDHQAGYLPAPSVPSSNSS